MSKRTAAQLCAVAAKVYEVDIPSGERVRAIIFAWPSTRETITPLFPLGYSLFTFTATFKGPEPRYPSGWKPKLGNLQLRTNPWPREDVLAAIGFRTSCSWAEVDAIVVFDTKTGLANLVLVNAYAAGGLCELNIPQPTNLAVHGEGPVAVSELFARTVWRATLEGADFWQSWRRSLPETND